MSSTSQEIVLLDSSTDYLSVLKDVSNNVSYTSGIYCVVAGVIHKKFLAAQVYVDNVEKPTSFLNIAGLSGGIYGKVPTYNIFNQYIAKIKHAFKNFGPYAPFFQVLINENANHLISDGSSNSTIDEKKYYELLLGNCGLEYEISPRRQYILQFKDISDENKQLPKFENTNSEYELLPLNSISKELLNKTISGRYIARTAGSIDLYLKHNYGFILYDKSKDEILSESSTYMGNNEVALNVFTNDKYQKKGYGKVVISALVQYYYQDWKNKKLDNEFRLYWNTEEINIPSWKIAESVGFPLNSKYTMIKILKAQ